MKQIVYWFNGKVLQYWIHLSYEIITQNELYCKNYYKNLYCLQGQRYCQRAIPIELWHPLNQFMKRKSFSLCSHNKIAYSLAYVNKNYITIPAAAVDNQCFYFNNCVYIFGSLGSKRFNINKNTLQILADAPIDNYWKVYLFNGIFYAPKFNSNCEMLVYFPLSNKWEIQTFAITNSGEDKAKSK